MLYPTCLRLYIGALLLLVIGPVDGREDHLRTSSDSQNDRNLQTGDECSPLYNKTGFVYVELEGSDTSNVTFVDQLLLATSFELTYTEVVTCGGSTFRVVESVEPMESAVGRGFNATTELLRVDVTITCIGCPDTRETDLFRNDPNLNDTLADEQCFCEGPYLPTFEEIYKEIFATTIVPEKDLRVANVSQLPVFNETTCIPEAYTWYNSSGVCIGPGVEGFPSLWSDMPSEFPSEYPSEVRTTPP
jgi:hypothetical protein